MKKSRFTDEQIIGCLKPADAGMSFKELCYSSSFSQPDFNKWPSRCVNKFLRFYRPLSFKMNIKERHHKTYEDINLKAALKTELVSG
jgi:hypothetical protein